MAWDTAANILNDAAVELGLISSDQADPYDSTNKNLIQLCRMLKGLGQDLLRDYPWTHLQTRYTFPTVNGTASYALPTPFGRIIDGTAWNQSDDMPMIGPLSPQVWEMVQATGNTAGLDQSFRIFGDLFYISPTPSSAETIGYQYQSRYWVDSGGGTTPDSETPTDGADSLFFDRRLLIAGLKIYFKAEKGFDAGWAKAQLDAAVARARSADGAAPVLTLSRGSGMRFVDQANIPDSGWGS